jgi:glycosyltransferase involved in cell wall biosynthesis
LKLSVIVPAYNEENSILEALKNIKKHTKLSDEIIVVDDGSKDDTFKNAKKAGVKVLRHEKNKGYGAALKTGIREAKNDYILIIDADGTYPAERIPELRKYLPEAEMVVGERVTSTKKEPHILRKAVSLLASYYAGIHVPDPNSGLRIFKKEIAMRHLSELSNKFSFTTSITLIAAREGRNIIYHKIPYAARTGSSKLSLVKHGLKFPMMMTRLAIKFRPSKVFFPFGFLFLLTGLLNSIYTLYTRLDVTDASTVLITSGIQILLFGLLGDMIAAKRSD